MSEPEKNREGAEQDLLTLSDVAKKTRISMPTLQRYKKEFSDRIPSVGEGRKQRYPKSALEVFKQIKKENVGKRGRPRKDASAPPPAAATRGRQKASTAAVNSQITDAVTKARGGRKAAAAKAAAPAATPARRGRPPGRPAGRPPGRPPGRPAGSGKGSGLLTLTEIGERTGISYPTLVRYVKLHQNEIPHEGSGRSRRYHSEALEVFRRLRAESPRGGGAGKRGARAPRAAAAATGGGEGGGRRIQALERAIGELTREVKNLAKLVSRPLSVTVGRK